MPGPGIEARVSLPETPVKAAVGPGPLELGRQGLSPYQLDGLISRLKPRPTERHGMPAGSRRYEIKSGPDLKRKSLRSPRPKSSGRPELQNPDTVEAGATK